MNDSNHEVLRTGSSAGKQVAGASDRENFRYNSTALSCRSVLDMVNIFLHPLSFGLFGDAILVGVVLYDLAVRPAQTMPGGIPKDVLPMVFEQIAATRICSRRFHLLQLQDICDGEPRNENSDDRGCRDEVRQQPIGDGAPEHEPRPHLMLHHAIECNHASCVVAMLRHDEVFFDIFRQSTDDHDFHATRSSTLRNDSSDGDVDPAVVVNDSGLPLLHFACWEESVTIVEILLRAVAVEESFISSDDHQQNHQHESGEKRCVGRLARSIGALTNHSVYGTALHMAVSSRNSDLTHALCELGVGRPGSTHVNIFDINSRDMCHGFTPLHLAVHRPEACRILLNYGANVTAADRDGATPLHRAAQWYDPSKRYLVDAVRQTMETLLRFDPIPTVTNKSDDVSSVFRHRNQPIDIDAACGGPSASMNYAELSSLRTDCYDACHSSSFDQPRHRYIDRIVNAVDGDGRTPLHLAVMALRRTFASSAMDRSVSKSEFIGQDEVVKLLIEAGADHSIAGGSDKPSLDDSTQGDSLVNKGLNATERDEKEASHDSDSESDSYSDEVSFWMKGGGN